VGVQVQSNTESNLPNVLVLLATYNGKPWLHEQISSILCQEGVNVLIVIGDDNSNDGTKEMLINEWAEESRIQTRFWEKGSGSAGGNFRRLYRQVDVSRFDYVALADQDDVWYPGKLRTALLALETHGAHGYSCAVNSFWSDGREKIISQRPEQRGADFLFEGAGQGCTFVLTRELFQLVQRFCDEQAELSERLHYHDWLIYVLARAWGMVWYFDPRPWMKYRQHLGNEIGSRGSLKAITRRLALVRNGWYRNQVLAAINVFEAVTTQNALVVQFGAVLREPDSWARRRLLARFAMKHGRRRLSDRLVLLFASTAGWI
jgi:rhamnosyltransferase